MNKFVIALIAGSCFGGGLVVGLSRKPKVVEIPVTTAAAPVVTTAPDDQGPQEKLLARETTAHAEAPPAAVPAVVSTPLELPDGKLPEPEGVRWQDVGHLVMEQDNSEGMAEASAHTLRQEFSRGGYITWANKAQVIHIYETRWVVRISSVTGLDARRVCTWLYKHTKTKEPWVLSQSGRGCLYTPKTILTMKTEYTDIKP
jgi:hypothetical protein